MTSRKPIRDVVDVTGLPRTRSSDRGSGDGASDAERGPKSKFLSIWFRCCHVYGRLYRNAEGTRYEGRCPRCGASVHARIGPGGTNRRTFEAR